MTLTEEDRQAFLDIQASLFGCRFTREEAMELIWEILYRTRENA